MWLAMRTRLHRQLDEALADDPATALIAVHRLRTDELPWIEHRAVVRARHAGWSWARIGRLLGCSRQAVQQKYAGAPPRVAPLPPVGPGAATERALARQLHEIRETADGDPVGW